MGELRREDIAKYGCSMAMRDRLDRCAEILDFVTESMTWLAESPTRDLSTGAVNGLCHILMQVAEEVKR